MTKIVVSTAFCLLVFSGMAEAQGTAPQTFGTVPNIMTPEAATLGKYGTYPVSYYTGALNVSVPLYTIKENDLTWNLSLDNSSTGFIPNQEDGIVGLNWNLIAAGAITRQVNWNPDDQDITDNGANDNMNSNIGYIYGMLQAKLGTFSPSYITTLGFLNLSNPNYPTSSLPYEYSPDVFTFNFNGHNGRFFLGNDGTVKVSADHNYKVDLSGMQGQSNWCELNPSTIVITTDEGDIYTFGGGMNALEITYPSPDGRTLNCAGGPSAGGTINAWYLTSIQTHNGRTINFYYESQAESSLVGAGFGTGTPDPSLDYVYQKAYYSEHFGEVADAGGEQSTSNVGQPPTYTFIKTVYLDSIVSPTTVINFSYTQKANDFYGSGILIEHNKPNLLTGIHIKDKDENSVKYIALEYSAIGNTTIGYRNFLNKVDLQDAWQNTLSFYHFSYYNTANLPNPVTKGVDLWGYYNGNDGNTSLVPTANSGSPYYNPSFTGRSVNPGFANLGLLDTIYFPTGGWSQFNYESHDYGNVLRRTVPGGFTPQWSVENGYVGGARIQQVTNSDGVTKSYFYKQGYDPNNPNAANLPSSGILTDNQIFFLDLEWADNSYPYTGIAANTDIQDNNIAASASYGESPIGYSEVTEVDAGNGFTKYYYSTQQTNPDTYTLGSGSYVLTPSGTDPSTTNFFGQMERLIKYSSDDLERGKLLKTQIYKNQNSTSTLLKEIDNTYNTDPSRFNQSVIGFNFPIWSGGWAIYHSYALYYFQTNMTSQTTKDYTNGGSLTSTINYTYISNTNPLVRTQSQVDSKGDTKSVNYTYPGDLSSTAPYSTMVSKNMISSIVQQDNYKNTTNLLTSTHTNYNYWTGTAWDGSYNSGDLILPQNIQTKTLSQSSYDTRFGYDTYNTQGDVTSYSKPGDVEHSYIWGYHKLYPIAEALNANSNQVAYTSFEDADLGGWTLGSGSTINSGAAFTGTKTCSGSISKAVPLGNYVVTLWSNTSATNHLVNGSSGTAGPVRGSWQLYTYLINNTSNISVTVDNADEVRLYPVGAQMTTYTYNLLVGETSRTDVDNRTTYFTYDPIGRLYSVTDQDGNILKKYCYNYAGQQTVCNFYQSAAINASYTSQSCGSGYYPLPYQVVVPQGMFMSYVSQTTADSLAQAYAQNQANANGSCAISPISFYAEDEDGASFTIDFHNQASGVDYYLTIDGHSDGTIDIPPGTYNIIFTPSTSGWYNYFVCSGYSNAGPSTMEFDGVSVNSSCSSLYVE